MNPYFNQANNSYRQAAAAVHPTVAVVKLYDATLLAMLQAIKAREANQFEECFIKVMRAATILRGLDHALDFDKGGAVAERLHKVYQSYILALHISYGKKDVVARYTKLHDSLAELRNSWAKIAGMPDSTLTKDSIARQPDPSPAVAAPKAGGAYPAQAPSTTPAGFDATAFIGLTSTESTTHAPRPRPRFVRSERSRVARSLNGG